MRGRSSLAPARCSDQVSGGRGIEIACGEISLFFFAVGILYLLLVFFAIQVCCTIVSRFGRTMYRYE